MDGPTPIYAASWSISDRGWWPLKTKEERMVDRPKEIMDEWDWRIRGHKEADYLQGRLPVRQLDFTLPETVEGVRELSAVIYNLMRGIDKAQVGTTHIPAIVAGVNDAFRTAQLRLADDKEKWEGQLRARQKVEQEQVGNVTRLSQVG